MSGERMEMRFVLVNPGIELNTNKYNNTLSAIKHVIQLSTQNRQ